MELCKKCNGLGSISSGSGFINAGECPEESKTCNECDGSGLYLPTFFVEYTFKNYENTYWFPLFIRAENKNEANKLMMATKKGLEEKYSDVRNGTLIPKIENITTNIINSKFLAKSTYKVTHLNVNIWDFTPIENNPELSFNEHLEFIMYNTPLYTRDIAERVNAYQFPVRVIKSNFQIEFEDYLLIDVIGV